MTIVYLDERMMCAALMFIIDYIQVIKFSASTHTKTYYMNISIVAQFGINTSIILVINSDIDAKKMS